MMNIRIDKFQRVIQYFWDPPVKNDDPMKNSIWCLGLEYSSKTQEPESKSSDEYDNVNASSTDSVPVLLTSPSSGSTDAQNQNDSDSETSEAAVEVHKDTSTQVDDDGWPHAFLDDFDARFWMTYRSGFTPIPLSTTGRGNMTLATRLRSLADQEGFTTDTGWGCMIRSGQCVLANTISLLQLGRDWRRGKLPLEEQRILSLFADDPKAPFSLHNFVKYGEASCGVHPGEWFGPSATARCIQALATQHDEGLRVYITGDGGDVYEDAFRKVAISDDGVFHPTLVLVGIRLGIERVTPVYWEALKSSLMMSQSVGIAGGRPSASHYFVGVQGQFLFYLDPHNTRPLLPYRKDPGTYTPEEIELCHTRKLRRLHLREMDPSMLLAFLIRDEKDWQAWKQGVKEVHGKRVVHVSDVTPGLGHPPGMREDAVDDVDSFDDDSGAEEVESSIPSM
ncbi:Cysteine protease atg4 [Orbilia brochopaga]|uniref:Cysteine protease n=1 Tax=Orbilia brochopaga TaxID=3140254 RepID=A0AAV9VCJ0_9PEZI